MYAGTPHEQGQPTWVLLEPLRYRDKKGFVHVIPEGFATDFASVPRIPLGYMVYGNRGLSVRPAVLHDYYCRTGLIDRKEADKLFLEAMLEEGMPEADAKSMFWAVRAYSKVAIREDGKDDEWKEM